MSTPVFSTGKITQGISILHVEDNSSDAFLIGEILGRCEAPRIVVTHAPCLTEALLKLMCTPYHLILLDLHLPDANLFQALRKTQLSAPTTPLIAVTESADEETRLQTYRAGAWEYLTKSSIYDRLIPIVKRFSTESPATRS